MRSTHLFRLPSLALALFVAACSDSTAPTVTPVDLPTALAEMQLSSYVPAEAGMGAFVNGGLTIVPSACPYNATSQSFACPTISNSGITMSRSFQLLSAAGTPQSAFDQSTTAAIRTTTDVNGTMSLDGDQLTIAHHEVMTLSGLLTNNHVLDGTQQSRLTGTISGYAMDETINTTISGLRLPSRNSGDKWPLGGTISITSTDNTAGGFGTSTTTMTFNGTSVVTITFTGGGFSEKCTLDLAKGPNAQMVCS